MYKLFFVSFASMVLLSGCATAPREPQSAVRSAEHNSAEAGGNPGSIGTAARPPPASQADTASAKTARKALENGDPGRVEGGAE
jgi:hypothetical protein